MKKTMRRAIVAVMAVVLAFSLTACGGNGGASPEKEDALQTAVDTYKLDLKSTEEQAMSSERATKDQLKALKNDFFKGTMMFTGTEFENLTYGDIKDELGVDASYYYYEDSLVETQCFVWQAEESDNARLLISFVDGKLYGLGSSNLGVGN